MTEPRRRSDRPTPKIAAAVPCPFCGSTATQPFTFAGPGARQRRKCTRCGRLFQAARPG